MIFDPHEEDKHESESLRLRFQVKHGKRYDGRYHMARKLFEHAWDENVCQNCQNKWFEFYFHKSGFSDHLIRDFT